jgi:superfamily II DNA or RNA helicase
MGAATEKLYCLTKDNEGNIRIPLGLAIQLWNIQIPDYTQLPRKQFQCSIQLGLDGRDYQIPTYHTMTESLVKTRMAYLSVYCGFGKSILGVKAICELGIKAAVLTDSTLILPQWVKLFKTTTNMRVEIIDTPVEVLPDADVYVMMVTCCGKMHPKVLEPIKMLIVDECAYFMTPTRIPAILNFTPCYVLGLCAEVKRTDGMCCFLPYLFGQKVIRKISEKPFTVYRVETQFKPRIQTQRWKGTLDWNLVLESLAVNEQRNDAIIKLCMSIPDSRIIIGTKRKDQANYIFAKLKALEESTALLIEDTRTFPQCRILVGIYAKMGKGVDVKNLCDSWEGEVFDVAILALDLCNPEQFVGRVFRHNNPVIYDIVDDFSTLRKHFEKEREPWYKSRNGVVQRMII